MDELPIELRRVETTHTLTMMNKRSTDTLNIKSKSLGDILEIERLDLVRSRSSIPGFCSTSELILDERSVSSSSSGSKPRLVKQKLCVEETGLENPEDTAIENLIKDLPDFSCQPLRKRNVPLKQNSMNEELMSAERLEEKERVRRNIMKQASLNEELICKWRTFEAFKESISPVSASRRFQLLKNGLTNKLKRSTTNIEKVSSISIKNGFVRMLQGWKSCENESVSTATAEVMTKPKPADNKVQSVALVKRSIEVVERRLSREDGSDSSKDSSLQSDTSVDSEDSFASVIFIPKQDIPIPAPPASLSVNEVPSTPRPAALQLDTTSAPSSPRVKQSLDSSQSSRFKLMDMSSLLKQQSAVTNTDTNTNTNALLSDAIKSSASTVICKETSDKILQTPREHHPMSEPAEEPDVEQDTAPLIHAFNDVKMASREPIINEDDNRKARLNQIKELLIAKPGFATRARPSFPLVRRASTAASGRLETVTRILPRLLSLELFNPETDDLDSDSSGVSSPESVGSVISVTSDERYIARKEEEKREEEKKNNAQTNEGVPKSNGDNVSKNTKEPETIHKDESLSIETTASFEESNTSLDPPHDDTPADFNDDMLFSETDRMHDSIQDNLRADAIRSASRLLLESGKSISSQSMKLLEAAANVASSLENAVETAIQRNTQVEQFSHQLSQVAQQRNNNGVWSQSSLRTRAYLKQDRKSASVDLDGYADESSSNLMQDISRYCQNSSFDLLCQTSKTSSSSLDNKLDAESDATAWDGCNQVPKETSWIINKAYDRSGYEKFAKVIQSKLTPKSKSLCEDHAVVFESEFDHKFKCDSKYKVKLEAKSETRVMSKYDEPFKFDLASEENSKIKFDLVSTVNPVSNNNFTDDNKKTFINPKDLELNSESTFNFQSGADPKRSNVDQERYGSPNTSPLLRSSSDDMLDFVMVSKTGEFECEDATEDSRTAEKWRSSQDGLSIDSSYVGDSIMENTTSPSDGSQEESTARLFTGSTVSLASNPNNVDNNRRCSVERRRLQERGRSLDEMSSETKRRDAADCLVSTNRTTDSISNASSQESLSSDRGGGGSITYHQYYHVFREGELDQLINKYVENLHIISSYYDHASWCVVAEKVQVWTI